MGEFLRKHWAYLIGAVLLHVVFAGIFGLTMITMWRQPTQAALAIQAVVVDRSVLDRAARKQQRDRTQERERQQAEQRRQQERREQEQRAEQEQRQREQEQQRKVAEEQQIRERQDAERKRAAEAEQQRAVEAERQRKVEAERKRVAEIERKQQEEAERRKAADDARAQAQRESELRNQIEEEEGRDQAANAGLLNQYIAMIEQRIVRNWNRPLSARTGLECRVRVAQTPGGTVLSVQIDQCNGDAAVKQSIEAAVMRSSPLPPPPDPRLFERNLLLVFSPTPNAVAVSGESEERMLKFFVRSLALVALAALVAPGANAQLVIEITRGQENAVPIAIVPFGWESANAAPFDVAQVVAADLQRSGRFAPLDRKDMIDRPSAGDQIRFQDWRYLKSDFILVGKLTPQGADRYSAQFELYNVLNGQKLTGQQLTATTTSLRAMSHRIADIVFEQLTGIRGAFSTRIAFVSAEGTPPKQQYKLIVSDADGENQQTIATSSEPIMSPAWSPDGQSLAYVSFESKASAIYVQTLRSGERSRVSARSGINGAPAWSPDGRTLALTLSRKDGDVDIYTLKLAAQTLTRMTFDPGIDTEPSWSADGRKLYFMSDRAGGPQIYEIDVAQPERATRVTFEGSYNARPRLSPDGKQLAVVHLDRGNFRIAIVDLQSRGVQVLSPGRQDESPSFAPNGATLIYATQDRGRGVLATVSVDGRVQQRLAASSGDVREPVWSPFPPGR